ncbi:MAG: glycosyltransferase family 4 protein [Armatimonadota bacterium]|nr:glycosyltransferase family 4 protein [Armatimonadota bacterium]
MVSQTIPQPPISGARIRLAHVIAALATMGEVDVFAITDRAVSFPPGEDLVRINVAVRPPSTVPWPRRLWALARGDQPLALAGLDAGDARRRFVAWAAPTYDLVWFHRAESYAVLGDLVKAPAIVDLDDLEDRKARARLAVAPEAGGFAATRTVRRWLANAQGRRDARAWQRWQAHVAASVPATVVCSESDRRHLGAPSAVVIANGYDAPVRPAGRETAGDPPTVLFAGFLPYAPNLDAARWLVHDIAPRIRHWLPGLRVRLVGETTDEVRRWHDPPGVTVTGVVPDMRPELATADLVAVPMRFGGGTRIKILEAFAHRIPVVSTTAGAEGFDVAHERELLLADDAEAFAAACVRLLGDIGLRRALTEAAHRLFQARHRWPDIEREIVTLAARVAAGGPHG